MYRDMKGLSPEVGKIDGELYLRTSTGHGRYGVLEDYKGEHRLLIQRGAFVAAVKETLPYWMDVQFPPAYRSLYEIMNMVNIEPRSRQHAKEAEYLCFPLNSDCIITIDYSQHIVSIPVHHFVVHAVNHLVERPVLDVNAFSYEFGEEFRKRWKQILFKARQIGVAA